MNKAIIFDMDGTIADLYGVDGWLEDLRGENPRPYLMAKPLVDMELLANILETLKNDGWSIVITSWLAKDSTSSYDEVVRQAKKDWLKRYDFPYDEIHLTKYGRTKASCTRKYDYQILIDDNDKVRKGFDNIAKGRKSIDAKTDFISELIELLLEE